MRAWHWVEAPVVYAVHDRQIAEHGGLQGVRDLGAVESALTRPRNLTAYGAPDAADLAAAYAFGLAVNHGFADGNKRTAWIVARLFLADNGATLRFDPAEAVLTITSVVAGVMDEAALADWFRRRLAALGQHISATA
jgi:death-on-curing protein